jgi:hypothetical protein
LKPEASSWAVPEAEKRNILAFFKDPRWGGVKEFKELAHLTMMDIRSSCNMEELFHHHLQAWSDLVVDSGFKNTKGIDALILKITKKYIKGIRKAMREVTLNERYELVDLQVTALGQLLDAWAIQRLAVDRVLPLAFPVNVIEEMVRKLSQSPSVSGYYLCPVHGWGDHVPSRCPVFKELMSVGTNSAGVPVSVSKNSILAGDVLSAAYSVPSFAALKIRALETSFFIPASVSSATGGKGAGSSYSGGGKNYIAKTEHSKEDKAVGKKDFRKGDASKGSE